jgi:polysaccharide pyruvyl transferase WcaK-like protein
MALCNAGNRKRISAEISLIQRNNVQNKHNRQTSTKRIALFGLFGVGNLGNDATLTATLFHLRERLPDVEFVCICVNPTDVTDCHNINAIPIDLLGDLQWRQSPNRVVRLLLRIPVEIVQWIRTYRLLQQFDLLLIPGTGVLDDFGVGPFQLPLDIFRWSLLAKLRGIKVCFMSIGAGPIQHPLSRWFMKVAANCADYRSYRDEISKAFMSSIGLNTQPDLVYPDLVFSLPRPTSAAETKTDRSRFTVGLGVMAYYGWRNQAASGEQIYQNYLAKLTSFALWLLKKGYCIRLLVGERNDQRAVAALFAAVTMATGQTWHDQIIVEQITALPELLHQIAATDMVVATRFHNIVGALMMNKPTISLGYAKKNDVLMAEMGLGAYCQHIESFDVDQLIQHFTDLEAKAPELYALMQEKNQQYNQALNAQYAQVTGATVSGAIPELSTNWASASLTETT